MSNNLFAGWGEADITPDNVVVELSGQYYQRLSQGIHSRLKTVVLLLEQAETCTILASIDGVGVPEEFLKRLEKAVARRLPELADARLIINATHTHCAPGLTPEISWRERSPQALTTEAYQDILEARLLEAVAMAWSSRQPCGVANVLDYARIGHCRRAVYADGTAEMYGRTARSDFVGMEGGEDSGIDLLFFCDERKNPTGVVVNVACPSQVMEATYLVSSDFMGALRAKLKQEFGPGFTTLCQISAAGCQSPRDLVRNYKGEPDFWHADGVEVHAERLLQAVKRAYARAPATFEFQPALAHRVVPLSLPRRKVSHAELVTAHAELDRLLTIQGEEEAFADFCRIVHTNEQIPGLPGPYDSKLHHFVLIKNQQAVLRRYLGQVASPEFSMTLHVMRVGKVAMAFNPFELFLEYGQRIKAESCAEQTFVVQLANGTGGYLPTVSAEQHGGYGGLVINGQVGSSGGSQLVAETVAAIGGLWADKAAS
jgi:hypothetical protein